jgi:hypothetical protein
MAITGEAYGGSMLVTGWTNQNLGQAVGTLSANLEDGAGPAGLSQSSGFLNGFLAQTFEAEDCAAGTAIAAGIVQFQKLFVSSSGVSSTAWWYMTTTAATAATGSGIGLYSLSGNTGTLIAQTTSGAGTNAKFNSTGVQSAAWTAPVILNGGTTYYTAVLIVTSAAGVMAEVTGNASLIPLVNANTAAPNFRFSVAAATGATVLPATTPMNTSTAAVHAPWIAIS